MDTMPPTTGSSGSKAKALIALVVIALIILVVVVDAKRRAAESQLQQLSLKLQQQGGQPDTAQNQAIAKQVIAQVSKLYDLPTSVQPTVATIVDVEALRKQNAFYNKAQNGDYLIITPERAILFDPQKNMIVDVVPVQLQPPTSSSSSSKARAATNPTPTPAPAPVPAPTPAPAQPTGGPGIRSNP